MISVTSGSRTNGSSGPRPRTLSPICRTMSSFSCAESGPSSSSSSSRSRWWTRPSSSVSDSVASYRRGPSDSTRRSWTRARTSEIRSRCCAFARRSASDMGGCLLRSLALPGAGEQALLLLLLPVVDDLGPTELAHLTRAAGEPSCQAADRLRDLGTRLLEYDRTALVQGRRDQPARREHGVDTDLHHALHVGGIQADLRVRAVQHHAETLPREPDREQRVQRLRQVLHADDVQARHEADHVRQVEAHE